MIKRLLRPLSVVAGLAALPVAVFGHFKLLEPAEWVKTNQLGDPQKAGPCGGDPAGKHEVTDAVTKVTGGSKVHIKVQETIYHSGHYRVALAVNSKTELPADPVTAERWTERGPYSTWAQIQSPPQFPVLVDGLFQHYPKAGEPASKLVDAKNPMFWETDVEIPNFNCPKCMLQVVQFMADHPYNVPGGYSYHHCAALDVTADSNKPVDAKWQAAVK